MWKIGELARRTGLTVRTLHHYDKIGLLSPATRSDGGHRVYDAADVARLYRIVSLRGLGFSLEDVGAALDGDGFDPRAAIREHLDRLDRRMQAEQRLRERLLHLLERLGSDDFLTTIEEMTRMHRYYSPEQLEQLQQRRHAFGDDAIRDVEREWAEIFATLRTEKEAGTAPADPKLRPIAERSRELVAMFTGGDPDIAESLGKMWRTEDPETLSRGMADAELMDYYAKLQAAHS